MDPTDAAPKPAAESMSAGVALRPPVSLAPLRSSMANHRG